MATKKTKAAPPASTTAAPAAPRPRRRVERAGSALGGTRASRRAEFADLDPEDAAIPLTRVPYVTSDLRRVTVMAVLIIVLIIVSGYLLSQHGL
jgi:hypothetical protein